MRIGHYAPHIGEGGGIGTYIRRVGAAQTSRGHAVYYLSRRAAPAEPGESFVQVAGDAKLFEQAHILALDVLHLHRPVYELPERRVCTVRTMHGNQGGCPSGSRYLERKRQPCDRAYSVGGCLFGHVVDNCGSRRPAKIYADFQRIEHEHRLAGVMPTYTVSQFLREQMVRAGCPMEKVHTILSPAPNVLAPYEPPPKGGPPRFFFAGRIVQQKGLDVLLRALPHVQGNVRVDVAGDGPDLRAMQELAERLGVADSVHFHGWCDPGKVAALMRGARAVVVPSSWHEPAGLVTLEAAAAGRPVIASRVGGIPEYASDEFALLVPPDDPEALAQGIEQLAYDDVRAEHMGRAGQEVAKQRYSMESFLDQLEEWYRQSTAEVVA